MEHFSHHFWSDFFPKRVSGKKSGKFFFIFRPFFSWFPLGTVPIKVRDILRKNWPILIKLPKSIFPHTPNFYRYRTKGETRKKVPRNGKKFPRFFLRLNFDLGFEKKRLRILSAQTYEGGNRSQKESWSPVLWKKAFRGKKYPPKTDPPS